MKKLELGARYALATFTTIMALTATVANAEAPNSKPGARDSIRPETSRGYEPPPTMQYAIEIGPYGALDNSGKPLEKDYSANAYLVEFDEPFQLKYSMTYTGVLNGQPPDMKGKVSFNCRDAAASIKDSTFKLDDHEFVLPRFAAKDKVKYPSSLNLEQYRLVGVHAGKFKATNNSDKPRNCIAKLVIYSARPGWKNTSSGGSATWDTLRFMPDK